MKEKQNKNHLHSSLYTQPTLCQCASIPRRGPQPSKQNIQCGGGSLLAAWDPESILPLLLMVQVTLDQSLYFTSVID